KDINWKALVQGTGYSSPVVWGKRIFVTSGRPNVGSRMLLCFSTEDGKELWRDESAGRKYHVHNRNSFATATPVVDESKVYVAWATPEQVSVAAYDHDGKSVWQQNLGSFKSQHGFGVSPIRFDDLVIVPNDQDDG